MFRIEVLLKPCSLFHFHLIEPGCVESSRDQPRISHDNNTVGLTSFISLILTCVGHKVVVTKQYSNESAPRLYDLALI